MIEPNRQERAIAVLKENKGYPTRKNDRKYLLTADCDVQCTGYRGCMRAYSLDLRVKIVEPVKKGVPKSETARRFGVARATVKRYCKQLDECGILEPRKAPGKRPKLDEKARKLLLEDLQERPWATHSQRTEFLFATCGVSVSETTVCRTLRRLSRTRKRSRGALERDGFLRLLWRMEVGSLDPECLVFVDEIGTHTFSAPLYTYSPVSERACFEIPRNLKRLV